MTISVTKAAAAGAALATTAALALSRTSALTVR